MIESLLLYRSWGRSRRKNTRSRSQSKMDRLRNTACNYIFVTNFFKLFLNIPTAYIPVLQLNTSHLLHQVEYGAGLWIRIHILRIQLFFSVRNFATFTYCNEVIWRHFLQTIRQNVTIFLYKHFTKLCLRKYRIFFAKVVKILLNRKN